jgi:putative GTP pyrophosphokinase
MFVCRKIAMTDNHGKDTHRPSEPEPDVQAMVEEYRKYQTFYQAFAETVQQLLTSLLEDRGIKPHSITARVKTLASLEGKLTRPGKHYRNLQQVTDLVGLRIIAHFNREVDYIGDLIDGEFEVDKANSVDKRIPTDPPQFGYASLHKVCGLSPRRLWLTEYRKFGGMVCEIQIRTILQHAWAEIEHDLGYKSEIAVPLHLKRQFSRLAALLEVADEQFADLSEKLAWYRRRAAQIIEVNRSSLPLDLVTLSLFQESNELLQSITKELYPKARPVSHADEYRLKQLHAAGIRDTQTLIRMLEKSRNQIVGYFRATAAGKAKHEYGSSSWVLRILALLVAANREEPEAMAKSLKVFAPDSAQPSKPSDSQYYTYVNSTFETTRAILKEMPAEPEVEDSTSVNSEMLEKLHPILKGEILEAGGVNAKEEKAKEEIPPGREKDPGLE